MKTRLLQLPALILTALGLALTASAAEPTAKAETPFSVTRHQPAIDAFLQADKSTPPPKEGILFIGSSIFREWTDLSRQMAPLPVINRAFGGSRTVEVLHYADTIVIPYAPKVVVYYCGSNDVNAGETAEAIAGNFRKFAERVHAKLPKTKVLFASILKAPQKKDKWNVVDDANKLIRTYCGSDPRLQYVDINGVVVEASNGNPRPELYREDMLHYRPVAYFGFTAVIRPLLLQVWETKK